MREQLDRGRLKFISFILLDIACLIIANIIAVAIYLQVGEKRFYISDYTYAIAYMIGIDIAVTVVFNTLSMVLRRKKTEEAVECLKHVGISIVALAMIFFSTKQGEQFSRVTVYMAYGIYLVMIMVFRTLWKEMLRINRSGRIISTALLITTTGYAREGLGVVENAGIVIKGMFITDKTNEGIIRNIPVIVDRGDAIAFLCWEWIDKVYVCGPENIDVPESLITACQQMGVPVYTSSARKTLDYEVLKIRTALSKSDKETGLSFFESEHDIPFRVSRLYSIYESEQNKQNGFHAHKQSWHLLFCPYGSIEIMIDTGKERKSISLDNPSTGLILHPSVWREMRWKKAGSILCVAASGHYDAERLRKDYNEYLKFLQDREWSATVESAEIMGEVIL